MKFSGTDHPISWLKNRYTDGTLQIRPPYQRKPVWVAKQKCYLIESILMGLPVPEIYLQQVTTAKGETTYAVVDGQQRVRTILQFIGIEKDEEEEEHNRFALDKIDTNSQWRNITFADLSDDDKRSFYDYSISVRLLQTDNEDDVKDMFRRLNKYLSPLNAQELRNATYNGPFVELALKFANDEYWVENKIVTLASVRRMKDVEFVSELLIGVTHGPQGGSSKVIDEYYRQYEPYDDDFPDQRRTNDLFKRTLSLINKVFPDIKKRRWGNKTDFYTLFVSFAHQLRNGNLPTRKITGIRNALRRFARSVDQRLADESKRCDKNVVKYVRAVEKGANDKKRRADRHSVLLQVTRPYFKPKVT